MTAQSASHLEDVVVVVAVRAAIARVVTAAVTLERARRVVPQESSLLRCKFFKFLVERLFDLHICSRGGAGRGRGAPPS